jgi:DNA mismatch repair protein MutS2
MSVGGALAAAIGRSAAEGPARRPAREDELHPGARLYIARLGSTVEVIERPTRGQVRVAAGPMKLFVQVGEALVEQSAARADEPRASHARASAGAMAAPPVAALAAEPERPMRTRSNTCDVRGLRVDDALGVLDSFLDRAYGEGATSGYVLHGHGTGALKAAVRSHLAESPYVARSGAADAEDGGDALTVFWIGR